MYCNSYTIRPGLNNNSQSYFGVSCPLDNLMMQGSLPSLDFYPPLTSAPSSFLPQATNFSLFFKTNISKSTLRLFCPRISFFTPYTLAFSPLSVHYTAGFFFVCLIWSADPCRIKGRLSCPSLVPVLCPPRARVIFHCHFNPSFLAWM